MPVADRIAPRGADVAVEMIQEAQGRSTQPTPVNSNPTRPARPTVVRALLIASTDRNGRFCDRYAVAALAAAGSPASVYPRIETYTRLSANAAKKP